MQEYEPDAESISSFWAVNAESVVPDQSIRLEKPLVEGFARRL